MGNLTKSIRAWEILSATRRMSSKTNWQANGVFRIIQSLELWFAMRFLVQLTGSFAELVGGLDAKRLELFRCFCTFHSSQFLEELLHAQFPPFRKGLRCLYDL